MAPSAIKKTSPDYVGLVRFLIQPFLEDPKTLSIDCEFSASLQKTWIRIAFDNADKGRVFGRGGRNIQAIRTVITAAAAAAGESVYLDIYGSSGGRDGIPDDDDREERIPPPRTNQRRGSSNIPFPLTKSRSL
ncbi:MAG: KH domain-containing protein [Scytonematopsis contorta HA4267-MV1]|jgi:hypothetical protein|nr:KH domain-containing protein [Scytonematopsis contorta HA4267-MV1]